MVSRRILLVHQAVTPNQARSKSVRPLVPAPISIPVYEVGTPAAVAATQVGMTGSGVGVRRTDVVDASGHTLSVDAAASGSMQWAWARWRAWPDVPVK